MRDNIEVFVLIEPQRVFEQSYSDLHTFSRMCGVVIPWQRVAVFYEVYYVCWGAEWRNSIYKYLTECVCVCTQEWCWWFEIKNPRADLWFLQINNCRNIWNRIGRPNSTPLYTRIKIYFSITRVVLLEQNSIVSHIHGLFVLRTRAYFTFWIITPAIFS